MNKKYKLTSEKKEWCGHTLFRIEALASFGSVSKGDKGGFIEKEENLDQENNAWVYGDARVSGDAQVYGNARVSGNAQVSGKLKLSLGYFFGMRWNKEEIKYHKVEDNVELIYKGDAKIEEGDDNSEKKAALMSKADELIQKANELKEEADKL